jgi:hypothetical protein
MKQELLVKIFNLEQILPGGPPIAPPNPPPGAPDPAKALANAMSAAAPSGLLNRLCNLSPTMYNKKWINLSASFY